VKYHFRNSHSLQISDDNAETDIVANWYYKGNIMEIRIPWLLLGFTDPSTRQVAMYPGKKKKSWVNLI
jgi:hypothetical protein